MKPVRLEMQAFGPYDERTVIDFGPLSQGLFLVTGETGSGKTMIFDAMTYALFGETTGNRRGADSLKSDFTDSKPYVQLDFVHDGIGYTVRREPSYSYVTRNGTESKKTATSELWMEGECICNKNKSVNEAVEEILGIGSDQWGQISMIAQGEFVKLLDSDSNKRSEILGRLFRTERFTWMIDELKRRSREKDEEYEKAEDSLGWIARTAVWTDDADVDDMTFDDVASALEASNASDSAEMASLKEACAEAEKTYVDAVRAKSEAETLSKDFSKLEEEIGKRQKLQELKGTMDEKRGTLALSNRSVAMEAVRRDRDSHKKAAEESASRKAELISRYDAVKAVLNDLGPQYDGLPDRKRELKETESRIVSLKAKLESCINASNIGRDLEALQKKIARMLDESCQLRAEQEGLERSKSEASEAIVSLASSPAETDACRLRLGKTREEMEQAEEDERTFEELLRKNDEIERIGNDLAIKSEELGRLEAQRTEMSTRFFLSQAGILAKSLEIGRPCPVCGSLEHPSPAEAPEDVPTERSIKAVESRVSGAREGRDAVKDDLARAVGERNSLMEKLSKYGDSLETIPKAISDRLAALKEEESAIRTELESKESDVKRLEKAKEDEKAASSEIEALAGRLKSLDERLSDERGSEATLKERLRAAIEACEGADKESISSELRSAEAESARLSGEIESVEARMTEATRQEASLESSIKAEDDAESREKQALEEKSEELKALMDSSGIDEEGLSRLSGIDRDSLESEISLYDDAVRSNDALIGDLESRVEGKEKPDLEAAAASVESSKESLEVERGRMSIVSARLERNTDALGRIKDILPRWRILKTEAEDLRLLSDAASGRVQGGAKVPFDQYIQTVYFDSILGLANRRLKSMSGGRYELVRKTDGDNRGQHALDIDVMDNYTGIQRSVRTLSGGESFKAALSLALGLSDMVQYTAGGLRVETLFIDDGFGSLDSDSLEQAIAVLESLSEGDVMVGVISHVDLFKERMSKKICVSKKKNGGSFVEIVTD